MTPDKARELLENAAPGRWEYKDYTVYTNAGRDVLTIPDGVYGMIQEQDGPLVAAARDLAELVAGLRYEYAVQVTDKDGSVLYAKSYRTLSGDIEEAWWQDEPNEKLAEKWWSKIPACRVRILRRLVGDPEVVS